MSQTVHWPHNRGQRNPWLASEHEKGGGRERKETRYEQDEASLQYKILNISKGPSVAAYAKCS